MLKAGLGRRLGCAASIIDLDLNPKKKHGICMPRTDQTFSLWMEGDLVATGRNGCDMEFVSNELKTPECSSDMWVAIEAVDAEATPFAHAMPRGWPHYSSPSPPPPWPRAAF